MENKNAVSTKYDVEFVNHYYDVPKRIKFTSQTPDDVKAIISGLAAYYSGDECECFINGEKAILEGDWGLK